MIFELTEEQFNDLLTALLYTYDTYCLYKKIEFTESILKIKNELIKQWYKAKGWNCD